MTHYTWCWLLRRHIIYAKVFRCCPTHATPLCKQACQQRSSVRAALIGTQTELAEAAAELEAWTHEMAAFQDIVDAVSSALLCLCL